VDITYNVDAIEANVLG